ncbi:MAG TPA: leucyl aminopeptidase family protein [Candidatus Limnocylindrales bacterium]|nr:leucyl aminopeptidase family protein [Candidatus Limnocylindrales bacterium]
MSTPAARTTRAVATFDPVPSRAAAAALAVDVLDAVPADATAVAVPVGMDGEVPASLGLSRAALLAAGFTGAVGQALPIAGDAVPELVAVGVGDPGSLDAAAVRDAAAAFARAAVRHARVAASLPALAGLDDATAGQALVEGVLLARYRYRAFRDQPGEAVLAHLAIVADGARHAAVAVGVAHGRLTAEAAQVARDLANTPPMHLSATRMAEVARVIAAERGLEIEVYDNDALLELGCGGLLGVNAGSDEPARMVKLTYRPAGEPTGHLALVGKGIMYDAGGLSLKPSDAMHAAMKLDMSGAAAVLGAMSALRDLDCGALVTGYLMCTDNMPSGTAMRLGDVITMRSGMTVEVVNTDAEGRLVMADALALAVEDRADAIVTIATLTGAAMRTFGTALAAVLGNNDDLVAQLTAAGAAADEPVWRLPLVPKYRRKLHSAIADIKNLGGENAGTITAGLFLEEFVAGTPFGHLDICGPMMTDTDDGWRSTGATAFGTRLLVELALGFAKPA